MQNYRGWVQRFIRRHIVAYDPCFIPVQPAAGLTAMRSIINRYFQHSRSGLPMRVSYHIRYVGDMEALRTEGWIIWLKADAQGELVYIVKQQPERKGKVNSMR
jgi:hypothetical protein